MVADYDITVTGPGETLVTDTNGNTVFAKIETQTNGNAVINENDDYVTNTNTTVLAVGANSSASNAKPPSSGKKAEDADNKVPLDPAAETSAAKQKRSLRLKNPSRGKEPQFATDTAGWISE